ncbi:MAG: GNAT family N-acetyltransferase [Oceanicaulis sp.]
MIRPLDPADLDAYASIVADREVMRFIGNGAPQHRDEAEAYITDCIARYAADGLSRYALTDRRTGAFLGFSGFKRIEGRVDFGYRLARSAWGRGLACEAGAAVLRHGFANLAIKTVWAGVRPGNAASARVLEKLGFDPGPQAGFAPGDEWWRITASVQTA